MGQGLGFTYDSLGQLASMSNSSGVELYGWTYDRWGNRWDQTVDSGSGPSPQLSFNTSTNQIQTSGYTYDAAGNLTSDGLDTYTYDANGNVISVSGADNATYTYDALNRRVQIKAQGSDSMAFLYNLNGQRVSIWDANTGSQVQGQVYWGTRPLEFRANNAAHFQIQDWEGTERMQTSYNGAVEGTYSSLPYGDGYSASGTDDDAYHYAMLDQDNSSDDHAMFREYSNMTGRWMSPDPYMGSYNVYNPQSFNRYSYVQNNPLSYIDPLGLMYTIYVNIWESIDTGYTFQTVSYSSVAFFTPSVGGSGGGSRSLPGGGGGGSAGAGPSNPHQPQPPQQTQQKTPGVCSGLEHAGAWTMGLGSAMFLYGTAADGTVIFAPEGVVSQGSGTIGVAVGGLAYGIGDFGKFIGVCS